VLCVSQYKNATKARTPTPKMAIARSVISLLLSMTCLVSAEPFADDLRDLSRFICARQRLDGLKAVLFA